MFNSSQEYKLQILRVSINYREKTPRKEGLLDANFGVFATVAQLVEQRIRNAWVGGSTPSGGSSLLGVNYIV